MAVFQAAQAFELFTGLTPEIARMEAAFRLEAPAVKRDGRHG